MQTISVPLGERSYDVIIGHNVLRNIALPMQVSRCLLVTDDAVARCGYPAEIRQSLESQGIACQTFCFAAGEASKTLSTYAQILEACTAFELSGGDALLAVGGGVVGDITGFAAATYRRGVPFVQAPTTLLAAVDSSVGGKTGVNLPAGKNLVGAFWQPRLVLCDTATHATLPPEEYANGVAECLKYGLLWDAALFEALAKGGPVTESQIARCVALKRNVVVCDEHDAGQRRLLNLGHTLGHAIEQVSNFHSPHGAAVGIGMALMAKAFCPAIYPAVCAALAANHLPASCEFSIKELFSAMSQDKKRAGANITIVVPQAIGRCVLQTLPLAQLRALLEERL
jgi:3-dehydroquinate synthase